MAAALGTAAVVTMAAATGNEDGGEGGGEGGSRRRGTLGVDELGQDLKTFPHLKVFTWSSCPQPMKFPVLEWTCKKRGIELRLSATELADNNAIELELRQKLLPDSNRILRGAYLVNHGRYYGRYMKKKNGSGGLANALSIPPNWLVIVALRAHFGDILTCRKNAPESHCSHAREAGGGGTWAGQCQEGDELALRALEPDRCEVPGRTLSPGQRERGHPGFLLAWVGPSRRGRRGTGRGRRRRWGGGVVGGKVLNHLAADDV
ncbi:hypothetical protein C8F04DRAFT_1177928 [Mycena alexandri]|uniref:Uncharacterized protein n=1 Tax=Mycena alexandri TaxID=1745969 RepID=A0AAD6T710_9AGAR|nr:hypothetical protein C8F04DRAFT_1177928 [Mycena alexandri]